MWDFDSLIGKAQLYFQRAQDHPHVDDDEFALWLLLGFEFLLRAPLARVHSSLLASPEGNSILHSVGITTITEPKSVPSHTVIDRLAHVVPSFGGDLQTDARRLLALRNNELHTGSAALSSIGTEVWLPRFLRVAEVLCEHLGLAVDDLIGKEIAAHGRRLADAEDQQLCSDVGKRVATARGVFEKLQSADVQARRWIPDTTSRIQLERVECPACKEGAPLFLDPVRTTNEEIIDEAFVRNVILVATAMKCGVCGLTLNGTAEIRCAGLPQQLTRTESESFYDRFVHDYVDYDYGND